jgi:carbon monoxide dehydrogenase subunit G
MELTDQRDIAAPPDDVWTALVDADVLRRCIPGCQEMSGNPEDGYDAVVTQKVGPVKATFKGHVALSNVVPGQSCTISGEGKGGPAGFAKGGADVVLTPTGDGTRLSYDVHAKVGGKLAQLGSRVIDGFSKKMADQFFDNFKGVVEGDAAEAEAGTAAAGAAQAKPPEPAPGGRATPAVATAGEPTAPPAAPDEPQTGDHKKGWFRRLMG